MSKTPCAACGSTEYEAVSFGWHGHTGCSVCKPNQQCVGCGDPCCSVRADGKAYCHMCWQLYGLPDWQHAQEAQE
jgi:hypothetical protein